MLKADCFTIPMLAAGGIGGSAFRRMILTRQISSSNGQRNIFRQPWQRRADISIGKNTKINERVSAKYTFDIFNVTNTPSFDITIDNVNQNIEFNGFPYAGQPGKTTPCDDTFTALYVCPTLSGLGITNKTIGSPRQIQMSLSVQF